MKKVLIGLCAALLFVLMSMTVLAGGAESWYYFTINGYKCEFMCAEDFPYAAERNPLKTAENGDVYYPTRYTVKAIEYNGKECVDSSEVKTKLPEKITIRELCDHMTSAGYDLGKMSICAYWEDISTHKIGYHDLRELLAPYMDTYLAVESKVIVYDSKNPVAVKVSKNQENPTKLDFADQKPVIADGRTLLPIRAIAEYYGWEVSWNQEIKSVTINNGQSEVRIDIGSKRMSRYEDSKFKDNVELDVPAIIINGRTMLPVRAVSEAMGLKVEWNSKERCVYIDNSKLTGYGKFKFGMSMEEAKAVVDGPYEMGEDGESICLEDYFKNKYKNEDASITGDVACQDIILYFDNNKLSLIYVMTESLNKQESEEFFAEMIKLFGDNYKPAEYNENGYEWYFEEGNIIVRLAVYDYENTQFNYEFNFLDKDYI